MNIPLTFNSFSSEENFLELQNKFAIYDERENPCELMIYETVVKEDFFIFLKSVDIFNLKEDYEKKYFVKDFLLDQIDNLAKRYITAFKINLEKALLVEKEKVKKFAGIRLNKFKELHENLKKQSFITLEVKQKVLKQINIVSEYLTNVHIAPNYTFEDKIKFKWNKADMLLLFLILREKKIIDHPYDNEFGMLLDKSFLYYNKKNEGFESISGSSSVINDYKNGNRGVLKSLARIKKVFTDSSLYDFPNQ